MDKSISEDLIHAVRDDLMDEFDVPDMACEEFSILRSAMLREFLVYLCNKGQMPSKEEWIRLTRERMKRRVH